MNHSLALAEDSPAPLAAGIGVPFKEREEFELLPAPAKADALAKIAAIRMVLASPGQRWRRCAEAAQQNGLSQSTVYEAVRNWLATHNWRDLVDRRLVREWQKVNELNSLTPEMVTELEQRIYFHKGGTRQAYLTFKRDLARWRRGGKPIKGFGYFPPADAPGCHHPAGCSLKSFQRLKDAPTAAGVQLGRRAADKFLPMVRTTRFGVEFGEEWFIDDMYENLKALVAGQDAPRRLVNLGIQEYLTAFMALRLTKPLTKDGDSDVLHRFGEKYSVFMIMNWATQYGVHCTNGGRMTGEGGTATMPTGASERLEQATNGLFKFYAGVPQSRHLVKGQDQAAGKGNPRAKAQLESHHNVLQRAAGDLRELPGQLGNNPDDAPEDLAGREVYAKNIIKAAQHLAPSVREHLRLGFLALDEVLNLLAQVLDRVHDEADHALEGWESIGHTVKKWRWSREEDWRLWDELAALPAEAQAQFAARCAEGKAQVHLFRMTRREAWFHRMAQRSLVQLPYSVAAHVMGEELMEVRRVTSNGEFTVASEDAGSDTLFFRAALRLPDETFTLLDRGAEYQTWFNPLDVGRLLVRDLSGRWLGVCATHAVTRTDHAALNDSKRIKKTISDQILSHARELVAPLAAQNIADKEFNAAILAGAVPDAKTGRLPPKADGKAARAARSKRFRAMAAAGQTLDEISKTTAEP